MWRIDPLLGKSLEANYEYSVCYATATSEQRFSKHVPAEMISGLSLGNRPQQ
jgi:hypothetical protein